MSDWNLKGLLSLVADQAKQASKYAGYSCAIGACNAISLGARCSQCLRQLCAEHTLWHSTVTSLKPRALCTYCVVQMHADLFADVDKDEANDGGGASDAKRTKREPDVIDAVFTESGGSSSRRSK